MARKIKVKTHKKRVRGHRQNNNLQAWERGRTQRYLQEQARRRRMTRLDGNTGEEYMLARLAIKDNNRVDEYRQGLAAAIEAAEETAEAQSAAIRDYIQASVDGGILVPIPCEKGETPVCRIYQGEKPRVVVIRQETEAEQV